MLTNCEFTDPVDLNPNPALSDWNYSKMYCETQENPLVYSEIISDGENYFNLDPTFSYAEIVIIFFLICFFVFKIFSGIWNFVHTFIIRQKWLR